MIYKAQKSQKESGRKVVTEAHVCEQLALGRYPAVSRCGVEPAPLSYLRIISPTRYR